MVYEASMNPRAVAATTLLLLGACGTPTPSVVSGSPAPSTPTPSTAVDASTPPSTAVDASASHAGPEVAGNCWSDPLGDVVQPGADILGTCALVDGDWVDLRIQFAGDPYVFATETITVLIDADSDPDTTHFSSPNLRGVEAVLSVDGLPGYDYATSPFASVLWGSGQAATNVGCESVDYDSANHVLRVRLPLSSIDDDGVFSFHLEASYGGSALDPAGQNYERMPETDTPLTSQIGWAPFRGTSFCDR